jgi:hypothetical protein
MKKNAMLKIAAILMVAVLLTTCAISSTFAKYVTDEKKITSNSARVAVWGLEISGNANANFELFKSDYDDVEGAVVSGDTHAVVVAPGTSNDAAMALGISGTPEVDYKINVVADVTLTDWKAGAKDYCPLVITVGTTEIKGVMYEKVADFEKAVELAMVNAVLGAGKVSTVANDHKYSETYDALTPAPNTASNVAISWRWDFEGTTVQGAKYQQTNADDTLLAKSNATIQIEFAIGAEQVSTKA